MTNEKRADVVFVIDASNSMKPCFDKLRRSLKSFIQPFRDEGFDSLRLGLLAYNAFPDNGHWAYRHICVNGGGPENMTLLYGDDEAAKDALFSHSEGGFVDIEEFCRILDGVNCCANENSPLALDCAADFPFEPLCSTRRVIVMFTDAKFELGVLKGEPIGKNCSILERVMNKIERRHITLYLFALCSESTEMMGEYSCVSFTEVPVHSEEGGCMGTWECFDFETVMKGIGKKVSQTVLQMVVEGPIDKAVYGQDKWKLSAWGAIEAARNVIDITHVREGCKLDMSRPMTWLNAKLLWNTPVDLDIHAFVKLTNGEEHEVSFVNPDDGYMILDHDAGIGNALEIPTGNEENIRCRRLDGIERIIFATKRSNDGECFSDYQGRMEFSTDNQQPKITVDMIAHESKTWCTIAMLDNSDPSTPRLIPVNSATSEAPDLNGSGMTEICTGNALVVGQRAQATKVDGEIFCSAFAPSEIAKNSNLLVQIYLHTAEEIKKISSMAKETQCDSERRGQVPLTCPLQIGDNVDVVLNVYGDELIFSQKKSIVWHGSFTNCTFRYFISAALMVKNVCCEILLLMKGVPVGEMLFTIEIVNSPKSIPAEMTTRRFKKVFISYAHQDESRVRFMARGFEKLGVDYFFDRDYLKAGDVFPAVISEYISTADLFVLFWSENAAKSEYVGKELSQALELAFPKIKPPEKATLSICAYSIEPRAKLPESMRNDYNFEEL